MFYAPSIFHTVNDELLIWGWVDEDYSGIAKDHRDPCQQGWAGSLTLLRELSLTYGRSNSSTPLLSIKPARVLRLLESRSSLHLEIPSPVQISATHFKIEAKLKTVTAGAKFDFHVRKSTCGREFTRVSFDLFGGVYGVDRSCSSLLGEFGATTVTGSLHRSTNNNTIPGVVIDDKEISISIYVDNSIVEVFVDEVSIRHIVG